MSRAGEVFQSMKECAICRMIDQDLQIECCQTHKLTTRTPGIKYSKLRETLVRQSRRYSSWILHRSALNLSVGSRVLCQQFRSSINCFMHSPREPVGGGGNLEPCMAPDLLRGALGAGQGCGPTHDALIKIAQIGRAAKNSDLWVFPSDFESASKFGITRNRFTFFDNNGSKLHIDAKGFFEKKNIFSKYFEFGL